MDVFERIGSRLNQVAGTDRLVGFSLWELFSETFKRRSEAEIEDYLAFGTRQTKRAIRNVESGWPTVALSSTGRVSRKVVRAIDGLFRLVRKVAFSAVQD